MSKFLRDGERAVSGALVRDESGLVAIVPPRQPDDDDYLHICYSDEIPYILDDLLEAFPREVTHWVKNRPEAA